MEASTLAWIGVIAGPLAAIATVFIQDRRAKHHLKSTTSFQDREAGTHEFLAMTEGFAVIREAMQAEFNLKIDNVRTELINKMNGLVEDYNEVIDHVEKLEQTFPNPPGAPPRPTSIKRREPYASS